MRFFVAPYFKHELFDIVYNKPEHSAHAYNFMPLIRLFIWLTKGAITTTIKRTIKLKTFYIQHKTSCFKFYCMFYCMFYCSCDRSLRCILCRCSGSVSYVAVSRWEPVLGLWHNLANLELREVTVQSSSSSTSTRVRLQYVSKAPVVAANIIHRQQQCSHVRYEDTFNQRGVIARYICASAGIARAEMSARPFVCPSVCKN